MHRIRTALQAHSRLYTLQLVLDAGSSENTHSGPRQECAGPCAGLQS